MSLPPDHLEYQSGPAISGFTDARKKACKQARICAIVSLLLGILILFLCIYMIRPEQPKGAEVVAMIVGAYGFVSTFGGVMYLIGVFKIKKDSLTWHQIVLVSAVIHLVGIAIWIGLLIWASAKTNNFAPVPFLVAGGMFVGVWNLILATRHSRNELMPPR